MQEKRDLPVKNGLYRPSNKKHIEILFNYAIQILIFKHNIYNMYTVNIRLARSIAVLNLRSQGPITIHVFSFFITVSEVI